MAVFSGSIYSDALKMDTTLHAVLTGDLRTERGCKPMLPGLKGKTLILLHGLSRNGAAWLYYVPLFRFAEQYGLRVILPDGHRSFYQDMTYGERYLSYIFEELPQLAHDLFGADISPENLMIAGLSMGGYGALRCAFTAPTHYAYAGAFSAPTQLRSFVEDDDEAHRHFFAQERTAWFGTGYPIPEQSDLFALAERCGGTFSPLFLACGRQDSLYPAGKSLYGHLEELGATPVWFEQDGGHDWLFWETALRHFLDFCAESEKNKTLVQ